MLRFQTNQFSEIKPRPTKGHEVASRIEDEQDDGIEFDPKRDITKKEKKQMYQLLEEHRQGVNRKHMEGVISSDRDGYISELWFSEIARALYILYPEYRKELKLDDAVFAQMKKALNKTHFGFEYHDAARLAFNLFILFPERRNELFDNKFDGDITDNSGAESFNWLIKYIPNGWFLPEMSVCLNIIFPDRKNRLGLNDKVFNEMKDDLKNSRGYSSERWWHFSNKAAQISLLYPDRKAELNVDGSTFEEMKKELLAMAGKDRMRFAEMAQNLYILAAERAEISFDGQILITPKKPKLTQAPKPLPIQLTI